MKKQLLTLVLALTFLTGCSKSQDTLLTYSTSGMVLQNVTSYDETDKIDMFADDLCIIPVGSDDSKDGNLTASSNLIVNATDGKMLYANNIYERLYPASITKIVTALVTLKYGNLEDTVTVSHNVANITESGAKLCGLKEGDTIRLGDLLDALLIYSGNDAGIAIAEHIAGSEEAFSDMMNEEVAKLGAVDSHFVNAHGLHDDNHYTTAYDLYLIFQELMSNKEFLDIINHSEITIKYNNKEKQEVTKTFTNTNRYLKGDEPMPEGITVLGGKTGTTSKAGSCLILYSKDSDEKEYISIILKSETGNTLFSQMSYLLKMIKR